MKLYVRTTTDELERPVAVAGSAKAGSEWKWRMMMQKCTRCGDRISGEEISEWRAEHEAFSMHPLICPDCWDNLQRKDLEDQFEELMEVKDGIDDACKSRT